MNKILFNERTLAEKYDSHIEIHPEIIHDEKLLGYVLQHELNHPGTLSADVWHDLKFGLGSPLLNARLVWFNFTHPKSLAFYLPFRKDVLSGERSYSYLDIFNITALTSMVAVLIFI